MKEEQYWILLAKKICGEATAEELLEFQQFIQEDPEKKHTYETLRELWVSSPENRPAPTQKQEDAYMMHVNRLKEVASDFESNGLFEPFQQYAYNANDTMLYTKRRTLKWATFFGLLIAGLALFFSYQFTGHKSVEKLAEAPKPQNEINVANGSKSKIELPDGTQVWINSGTKLSYGNSFTGKSREVMLDGEAYFDVVKDPTRPFIVHTDGIDIRVLGTVFNVKAYHKESTIEATLLHGSIQVTRTNQPDAPKVMLKPHEKLVFNKLERSIPDDAASINPLGTTSDARMTDLSRRAINIEPLAKTKSDSALREIAWVYNRLVFEDEPFDKIATRMERWFNVDIEIKNDKLKNVTITGSFQNETIEEALKVLQYIVSFRYKINGRKISITK